MTLEKCYREPTNGVNFILNAHRPDCTDPDCRGCKLCAARHCEAKRNCTWHVEEGELTCGRCIASARRNIRWIATLAPLMLARAVESGIESEAASLAGPAADPEAWMWRTIAARQGRAWHVSLVEENDERHPMRCLGTWAMMLTEDYGHDMPHGATLAWCADYLDRTLHRVAHDDEQDFPLLARELRKCRQHLEAVLATVERPDRGAPCPACIEEGVEKPPRLRLEFPHWCDDPDCTRLHYTTRYDADAREDVPDTSADRWVCSRNRTHSWTDADYRGRVEDRVRKVGA